MSSVHNVNKASDLLTKSYVKPSALIIWHKAEYTVDKAAVFPILLFCLSSIVSIVSSKWIIFEILMFQRWCFRFTASNLIALKAVYIVWDVLKSYRTVLPLLVTLVFCEV